MRTKNQTPFLFGAKPSSLRPPRPAMTLVVRGVFRLRPGVPVEPLTGLGEQGSLSGDVFAPDDDDRRGECLYPSDFADFKLRADLMLRAHCHVPQARPVSECPVRFAVGAFSKILRVVGPRVWKEGLFGASPSEPHPFTSMPINWAHAFGGPSYPANPSGKGLESPDLHSIEAPGDVVRSRGDRPAPAGFGPVSPHWPQRATKVGKEYGKEYREKRAPHFAEDFDFGYFNAAPPDQQIEGYLRGDEEMVFQSLHSAAPVFSARLPGVRVRAFVNDREQRFREVTMRLDTLLADMQAEKLYLTWRGVDEVLEDDLADIRTVLIVSEPLDREPMIAAYYLADIVRFEADPAGARAASAAGSADEDEDERREEDSVLAEVDKKLGALPSQDRERVRATVRRLLAQSAPGVDMRKAVMAALGAIAAAPQSALPRSPGAGPKVRLADVLRATRAAAARARKEAAAAGQPAPDLDRLDNLHRDPFVARVDPTLRETESTAEPGPGADLHGRDLSGQDFHGRDLSGADLEGANLTNANLAGADLSRARLKMAVLYGADLTGAKLEEAVLTLANLSNARAPGAILRRAVLDQAVFEKADLEGAELTGARGEQTTLSGAKMARVKARGIKLAGAMAEGADMTEADFSEASMTRCLWAKCSAQRARFSGASLTRTSFAESDLRGAQFTEASGEGAIWLRAGLEGADFQHADLPSCQFTEAQATRAQFFAANLPRARFYRTALSGAALAQANLLEADLGKAVLEGASLKGANLYGARLHGARLAGCDLDGANLKRVTPERA